jgi:penicillin-binding protein 1A
VAVCLFVTLVVGISAFGFYWRRALDEAAAKIPNLPDIMAEITRQPTVITDRNGEPLFQISSEYRKPVRIEEIPQRVIDATLAAEDVRFFEHGGIDYRAIARVLLTNAREGRIAQGGSTITMQLAKRVYSGGERTYRRKVQDMALAVMMERELTKEQILELYLNQIFYGAGAYGVQAAADVYFGKKLDQLTLAEAALLARCVRRPSQETPFVNPEAAVANRNVVLRTMLENAMISQREYDEAVREPLRLRKGPRHNLATHKIAPYFVDYVLSQIEKDMPNADLTEGGYRVETTLDVGLQAVAEKAVAHLVAKYQRRGVRTAAFLLCDRSGAILAMVGGRDYERRQYNAISQGRRQPGSAFKPFVYATAFELGALEPNDMISNARFVLRDPTTQAVWSPDNANQRYGGMLSVRSAFANSVNIPAVRVMDKVGPNNVVALAKSVFGFKSELAPYLSLALGASAVSPLEMAEGYSVFMLHGERFQPFGIKRIIGPDGSVVKEFSPRIVRTDLSPRTCDIMDGLMRAVVTSGTGRRASGIANARGKTGTTSDNRDAWFCGYTDEFLGIGWIANETYDPGRNPPWSYGEMPGIFGGNVTVEMWADVLKAAQKAWGEEARRFDGSTTVSREETPPETPPLEDAPQQDPDAPQPQDLPPTPEADPGDRATEPDGTGAAAEKAGTPPSPPPNPPTTRPKTAAGEMELVEICADSGARATLYCPEVVRRAFPKGRAPSKPCSLHGP